MRLKALLAEEKPLSLGGFIVRGRCPSYGLGIQFKRETPF